jgi:UDP-2-acetamido-3-amino-2,3-dideoxy-glucuronate N-acetyltransferase
MSEKSLKNKFFKHKLSDVKSKKIGFGTKVWQYTVILEGAVVGKNCNICSNCFLENQIVLGNNVTIKNGAKLFDNLIIEDDVFVGPNVIFLNDKRPRSKISRLKKGKTIIMKGASIGAGSIIFPGITIGKFAMVGAGSVITKNVPNNLTVYDIKIQKNIKYLINK